MRPHPAIRVLAIAVLGASLFQFSLPALIAVLVALILLTAARGKAALDSLRRAVRRIRWLLLSIVVIYLWVAPEPAPGAGAWLPAAADFALALRRAGVLVVLVAAVELLRQTTHATETAAAIAMLISPLERLGVDTHRFARRMALTLEAVPATSELVSRAAGGATIKRRHLAGWADAAAGLIREIETETASVGDSAHLPALGAIGLEDWLTLALVVLAAAGLSVI